MPLFPRGYSWRSISCHAAFQSCSTTLHGGYHYKKKIQLSGSWREKLNIFSREEPCWLWHFLHQMCPLFSFVPDHLTSKQPHKSEIRTSKQYTRVKLGNRLLQGGLGDGRHKELTTKKSSTFSWVWLMYRYAPGGAACLYQLQRGRQLEQAFHTGSAATKKKTRWKTFNGVLHKTDCHKTTWKTCFSKDTWETNRKTVILCPVIDIFFLGFGWGFLLGFWLIFWFFLKWVSESKAGVSSFVHFLPILLNIRLQDTLLYRFSSDNFVWVWDARTTRISLVLWGFQCHASFRKELFLSC